MVTAQWSLCKIVNLIRQIVNLIRHLLNTNFVQMFLYRPSRNRVDTLIVSPQASEQSVQFVMGESLSQHSSDPGLHCARLRQESG